MGFLEDVLKLLIPASVVVAGWWVANWLTRRREHARNVADKKREIQVEYLINAYRRLESTISRNTSIGYNETIETAIADVQLFGTGGQVALVLKIIEQFKQQTTAHHAFLPLLEVLRKDLRNELNLEHVEAEIEIFRSWPSKVDSEHYLTQAGWSALSEQKLGDDYVVTGQHGGKSIRGVSKKAAEAWFEALKQANALELGLKSTRAPNPSA